jgi:hypothetical protein
LNFFANLMTSYLHHVPGRLRVQTPLLRQNQATAGAVCGDLREIDGVVEARANSATGSLLIFYDRQRLGPSAFWPLLRMHGLVSGPPPVANQIGAYRISPSPSVGIDTDSDLLGTFAGVAAEKLLARLAMVVIRALI